MDSLDEPINYEVRVTIWGDMQEVRRLDILMDVLGGFGSG